MNEWKTKAEFLLERVDDLSDHLRGRVKRITGYRKPLMIVPFLGYGNGEKVSLKGRVIESKREIVSRDSDSRWQNLVNLYRRFETDEVPHAAVKVNFREAEREVQSDREGYFDVELEITESESLATQAWHPVNLELLNPQLKTGEAVRATAQVLIPPETARFGVISDIDDTVLMSNITDKFKMILTVALLNEHTRVPFEGVAAFYRALMRGASGAESNPVFYVSSSPWNLYAPLVEFLKIHDIPLGPLLLKDFGTHTLFSSGKHGSHKMENIRRILQTYPHLPFVLIGDSGEQDPEIYRAVLAEYPSRIRAIYIRRTKNDPARISAIDRLVAEVRETGCQLVLAPDTEFAAVHAAGEDLISTGELPQIRSEKQKNEAAPSAQEFI